MKTFEIDKREGMALSEFSAAVKAKCPRCRKGDLFSTPMYGFSLQKMHTYCPCCNLKFEKEPGYFYVAMFISYALNVAEMIALAVATYILSGTVDDPILYLSVILPAVFILSPFNYRYSRVMLLYWLTPGLKYDPERYK